MPPNGGIYLIFKRCWYAPAWRLIAVGLINTGATMSNPEIKTNSTNQLIIDLAKLQSNIQKQVGYSLSPHGIGLSDYFVLHELYQAPLHKMRRSDLAEKIGLSPSGVTRLLNPLEKIGLVEKGVNPRDARVSLVAITDTGKQIYKEASMTFTNASSVLFENLNDKQLAKLADLLNTII